MATRVTLIVDFDAEVSELQSAVSLWDQARASGEDFISADLVDARWIMECYLSGGLDILSVKSNDYDREVEESVKTV